MCYFFPNVASCIERAWCCCYPSKILTAKHERRDEVRSVRRRPWQLVGRDTSHSQESGVRWQAHHVWSYGNRKVDTPFLEMGSWHSAPFQSDRTGAMRSLHDSGGRTDSSYSISRDYQTPMRSIYAEYLCGALRGIIDAQRKRSSRSLQDEITRQNPAHATNRLCLLTFLPDR